MNAYLTQIKMSLLLTVRNRAAFVFGYGFPLAFFFLFGSMSGGNGMGQVTGMVLTIGVLGTGFFGAGMQAVMAREANILRRFKVAPISPGPILVAGIVGGLVQYMPMSLLMMTLANRVYHVPFPEQLPSLMLFLACGVVAFCTIGNMISAVTNSMQEATLLINLLYMPMLMLSGATIPVTMLPNWVQILSQFLPTAYFMTGIQSILRGRETFFDNLPSVGALALTAVVGTVLGLKLFRWEKDEKMKPSAKLWLAAVMGPFLVMGVYQAYAKTNIELAKVLLRDQARERAWLIHDARIFTGDGSVIDRGSVLLKNGKIEQIFAGNAPEAKSLGADPVEAAGKTLLPGLIDTSVHLASPAIVTRDPQTPDAAYERELAAYLYSGVIAIRNEGGDPAVALKHQNDIAKGLKLGAELLLTPLPVKASGLYAAESLVAYTNADASPLDRSLTRQVIPAASIDQAKTALAGQRSANPAPPYELAEKSLQAAFRASAPITPGTDSGNPLAIHGPGIHRELQLWVRAGISPAIALQAATHNAAQLLHADSRVGLIKAGMDASLLLVDGNPLEDITATERITSVFFKGERVDRSRLFDQK